MIILLCAAILLVQWMPAREVTAAHFERNLTRDFYQYWAAWQLMVDGKNPYGAPEHSALVNMPVRGDKRSFLPPWAFPLMAPCLGPDLATSALLFASLSFFAAAATVFVAWRIADAPGRVPLPVVLIGLINVPVYYSIAFGQPGTLLTLAAAGSLAAVMRQRSIVAGLCLIPLTLKPHLFILWFAALFINAVRRVRPALPLTCLSGVAILSLSASLLRPGIWHDWLSRLTERGESPFKYHTSTPCSWVRLGCEALGWANAVPYVWALLMGTAALSLLWFGSRQSDGRVASWAPALLLLNLICTPYAWPFDQGATVIVEIILLGRARATNDPALYRRFLVWITLLNVLDLAVCVVSGLLAVHWWLPIALLYLWCRSWRRCRPPGAAGFPQKPHIDARNLAFAGRFPFPMDEPHTPRKL